MPAKDQLTPSYWIVICPEPHVRGGLWARWYRENCVAVGWPPSHWSLDGDGPTPNPGWTHVRNRLKEVRRGDKVIPFLLKWRIGPVGTVREVRVADAEWTPTVEEGTYSKNPGQPELGRRILVTWERTEMPPDGRYALVPADQRRSHALARRTIEQLSAETFQRLCSVLSNRSNWIDYASAG
jgi:hypothetical protein